MSFERFTDSRGEEKSYSDGYMTYSRLSGNAVVNVDYYNDIMSVEIAPTATIGTLKGVLYEQTFLPPTMQNLFACNNGNPMHLLDSDSISMVPAGRAVSLIMEGDRVHC
mmetsp:Transcript_27954/g.82176  ORF Transcript_27954/g.82176 Transcript_27954/m.82176 type:complete len:109 (+) Transcript_27954:73-399(+)